VLINLRTSGFTACSIGAKGGWSNGMRPTALAAASRLACVSGKMTTMKITYYVERCLSWCYWAEPRGETQAKRYDGKVESMRKLPRCPPRPTPNQGARRIGYYRRSGTIVRSALIAKIGWLAADTSNTRPQPSRGSPKDVASRRPVVSPSLTPA